MENGRPKFIVAIGTSAGGFFALAELISQLDDEMDAAFFYSDAFVKTEHWWLPDRSNAEIYFAFLC